MNRKDILTILFVLLTQIVFSQSHSYEGTKTLKSDGKFREKALPFSHVITIIPAGTSVRVLSFSDNYYKVEYRGTIGFLNEMYFNKEGIDIKRNYKKITWDESAIKEYWRKNGMDEIEGIYESVESYEDKQVPCTNIYGNVLCYTTWRYYSNKYKLALVRRESSYFLIYLSGEFKGVEKVGGCRCTGKEYDPPSRNPWNVGEVKAKLYKTSTPNFFKSLWYMGDKTLNDNVYIALETGTMKVISSDGDKELYIKLYPTVDDNTQPKSSSNRIGSGTGFAISSNGIIATNYHVIKQADEIKVRGINSDFNTTYKAKVLISDKNNDLAIIKIDDYRFSSLGNIPYSLKFQLSNTGEDIFALGYPLRAAMGDEIKLTNGIISSKTGFQGDITSYQVSAPVQPGNSGGPLFDKNGNIIGVINAKLTIAENASYAIKSRYLLNLLEMINYPQTLPQRSKLIGQSLSVQVSKIKEFVYIIETK